jgi:hypothetical protein
MMRNRLKHSFPACAALIALAIAGCSGAPSTNSVNEAAEEYTPVHLTQFGVGLILGQINLGASTFTVRNGQGTYTPSLATTMTLFNDNNVNAHAVTFAMPDFTFYVTASDGSAQRVNASITRLDVPMSSVQIALVPQSIQVSGTATAALHITPNGSEDFDLVIDSASFQANINWSPATQTMGLSAAPTVTTTFHIENCGVTVLNISCNGQAYQRVQQAGLNGIISSALHDKLLPALQSPDGTALLLRVLNGLANLSNPSPPRMVDPSTISFTDDGAGGGEINGVATRLLPAAAPTHCTIGAPCDGSVQVVCDNNADPLRLWRLTPAGPVAPLSGSVSTFMGTTTLTDLAPPAATTQQYDVCATNAAGTACWSAGGNPPLIVNVPAGDTCYPGGGGGGGGHCIPSPGHRCTPLPM